MPLSLSPSHTLTCVCLCVCACVHVCVWAQSLSSSAPVASLQMNVTDYLKEAMTEDSVGSSPSKQKSTSRRAGHVARTPSAGIHVEFASDSESEPGNSLDERTVDAGLHQSGTTESSETNHIPCHMSPTMISPVFADEQEEGGFLLYDPLHTLSTVSSICVYASLLHHTDLLTVCVL